MMDYVVRPVIPQALFYHFISFALKWVSWWEAVVSMRSLSIISWMSVFPATHSLCYWPLVWWYLEVFSLDYDRRVGSSWWDSCPDKRKEMQRCLSFHMDTKKRLCNHMMRWWLSASKEVGHHQEPNLLAPWSWKLSVHNCQKHMLFKPLCLCHFVIRPNCLCLLFSTSSSAVLQYCSFNVLD